jgi:acyl carrier protein
MFKQIVTALLVASATAFAPNAMNAGRSTALFGARDDVILGLISEQMNKPLEELKPEKNFIEDLNCDSLDAVELIMVLEEEFDIEISDDDAENLTTVGSVIDYIDANVE